MDDNELKSWINEQLNSGYTEQEVENALLDEGINRNRIRSALSAPSSDLDTQDSVGQPATLMSRAIADVFDNFIAQIILGATTLAVLGVVTAVNGAVPFSDDSDPAVTVAAIVLVVLVLFGAISQTLYKTLLEARNNRTYGKRLVGIKVQSEDGSGITGRQALVRNLTLTASILFTGYLATVIPILIGDTNKRIGDNLAGTQVVES